MGFYGETKVDEWLNCQTASGSGEKRDGWSFMMKTIEKGKTKLYSPKGAICGVCASGTEFVLLLRN
jgi:hypothetical protein